MRHLPSLCAAAVVLALGACAPLPPTGGPQPAETHPIGARLETFRATVTFARAETAQPVPGRFVEEYYRRGRGPVSVVMPAAASPQEREAGERVAAWLEERLIPASLGRAVDGDSVPEGTLEVFFNAYVAVVPECGDWTGATGFNPTNLPHTNYGCSLQRNIGMMLSDPGDLLGAPVTGAPDTPRLVETMDRYRSIESIGRPAPVGEQTTIQVDRE